MNLRTPARRPLNLQLSLSVLLLCSSLVHAAGPLLPAAKKSPSAAPISLSGLARKSDLVALVQVKDTDYHYSRSFPSEGSAYLKILIAYKGPRPAGEIIEVYDHGLHPHECYFENPTVFEEGRRYLVFLRQDSRDPQVYRGQDEGCALEVLVGNDRRYMLRVPIDGIQLADKLESLATHVVFQDSYARVDEMDITPKIRDELLKSGLLIRYRGGFKYTQGVDLTAARKLMMAGLQDHKPH